MEDLGPFTVPYTRTHHFTAEEVTRRRAIPVEGVVGSRREVVAELARAGIRIADYPWP